MFRRIALGAPPHPYCCAPNSNYSPLELLARRTHQPSYVSVATTTNCSEGSSPNRQKDADEKTRKFGVLSKQGGVGGREEVELIDSSKRASAPHLLTPKPLNTFRREESTFFDSPHIYNHPHSLNSLTG